jgi:5-aminopentanamidase
LTGRHLLAYNHRSLVGIACAQLAPRIGEVDANRADTLRAIDEAAARGARLIVLPELCITGYAFTTAAELRPLAERAIGPTLLAWSERARRHDAVIVGGFAELDDDDAQRNSAAVVDGAGVRAVYRKVHLWAREQEIFEAGERRPPVVDTALGRVGVAVCYDMVFPELTRGLALDGADVVAVPMNSPLDGRRRDPMCAEVALAVACAASNRVAVAQADRTGEERGITWAEATVIVGPDGVLRDTARPGPALATADVDVLAARDKTWGARNHVFADRRPELYMTHHDTERPDP